MNSTSVDYWFPIEQQRKYVSSLKQLRAGLTRCRAEYFVKLWAYLLLKQQQELGNSLQKPLTELDVPEGFVPCTHREAYELFYGETDRGSDRSAGMMIDKLVSLGLIEKHFDGNTNCIRIQSPLPNFQDSAKVESIQVMPDAFNPRTDAIPIAIFFVRFNNLTNKKPNPQRTAKILRDWAKHYPTAMRVMRRCDNQHPVGFCTYYPVAPESEQHFFLPPRKSFHLSSESETDPIHMAVLGDPDCTSIFIRAWIIDSDYKQQINVCQFLEDGKKTLIRMQADFPNLCDLYVMPMQPAQEQLASAIGFQKTSLEPGQALSWMYMPLDQFLTSNMEQAVSVLKLY